MLYHNKLLCYVYRRSDVQSSSLEVRPVFGRVLRIYGTKNPESRFLGESNSFGGHPHLIDKNILE